MFHKNPFTKDNIKTTSTAFGAVFAALGLGTTLDPGTNEWAQIAYYGLAIVLFFLNEGRLPKV